jgi:pSer/pThr/pTyr-binding forkhead associated (FHA) protein
VPKPPVEEPVAPAAAASARTALASLEVINEGPMKGKKFELFTPLTNVGRGAHNDVQIQNDSVSDSHAKILRKDGRWYVVDQGSTNGTYVGGRRVQGEQQLVGAPDVRFGDVKVIFRPAAGAQDEAGSTRAVAAVSVEAAKRMSTAAKPPAPAPAKPVAPAASKPAAPAPAAAPAKKPEKDIVLPEITVPEKKKGCAAIIAFVFALGAAGVGMLILVLTTRG